MRSADDLKKSILAAVGAKRDAVLQKKAKRGTLADLGKLFDTGWIEGQRAAHPDRPALRITSARDKKAIKDKIIVPFRDAGTDVRDFAKWVTANWSALGIEHFAKSKYPAAPTIRWVLACIDTYTQAYVTRDGDTLTTAADAKREAAVQSIAARSQSEIDRLRSQLADAKEQLAARPTVTVVRTVNEHGDEIKAGVNISKLKKWDFADNTLDALAKKPAKKLKPLVRKDVRPKKVYGVVAGVDFDKILRELDNEE